MQLYKLSEGTAARRNFYFVAMDVLNPSVVKTGLAAGFVAADIKLTLNGAGSAVSSAGTLTEVDSTNSPGLYVYALTAGELNTLGPITFYWKNANSVARYYEVCVVAYDPYSATNLGLSALPTATAAAAGGLPTIGTGAGQLTVDGTTGAVVANVTKWAGTAVAAPATAGVPSVDVITLRNAAPNVLIGGRVDVSVGAYQSGQAPLQPTVAGRTLDVSAGGEAGVDWANVGSPTTGVALTSTTIQDATATSAAVANIAVTGAALNATAASAVYTTGASTGGVANTTTADGTFDSIADAAGVIDAYYVFDLSATSGAVAVSAEMLGYLAGVVNTLKVYARNFGGSTWDQVGTLAGIAGTTETELSVELTSAHTSAGAAWIRFAGTGLTSATLKVDRILLGYAVVAPTAAVIASNVWDAVRASHLTAGSFGEYTPAQVASYASGQAPLQPTVAGRTLDVSAGGEAGLDFANIGSPTTVVNLSGTTIKTATDVATAVAGVQSDTDDIQTRIPAALDSGKLVATVGAYQSGQAPLQPTVSGRTLDVSTGGEAGVDWANVGSPTTVLALSNTTVNSTAASILAIAGTVWDLARSGHTTSGTFGEGLNVVSVASAAANTVRDAVMGATLRSGRTVLGHMRRLDAVFFGRAVGLRSIIARLYQPGGILEEVTINQDPIAGTRTEVDCTTSETP